MDSITFRNALKVRLGVEFGDRPVVCKSKRRTPDDEHVDHLLNCKLFTAEVKDQHDAIVHEVHSLPQYAAKSFSLPKRGNLRTSTGDDGRTPDDLVRRLNIKPHYLDVTIANPTSTTYLNRGSSREEHVAIKNKEKLKNDKYSQRWQMIDSEFMPMAFEINGVCSRW